MPNICAVCGHEVTLTAMEDMEEDEQEKSYKVSCGHMYPYILIQNKIFHLQIIIKDVLLSMKSNPKLDNEKFYVLKNVFRSL